MRTLLLVTTTLLCASPALGAPERASAAGASALLPARPTRQQSEFRSAQAEGTQTDLVAPDPQGGGTWVLWVREYRTSPGAVLDDLTDAVMRRFGLTRTSTRQDVVRVGSADIDTRPFQGTSMDRYLRAYTGTEPKAPQATDIVTRDTTARIGASVVGLRDLEGRTPQGLRISARLVADQQRGVVLAFTRPPAFSQDDAYARFVLSLELEPQAGRAPSLSATGTPRLSLPPGLRVSAWASPRARDFPQQSAQMARRIEAALVQAGAVVLQSTALPPDVEVEVGWEVVGGPTKAQSRAYNAEGSMSVRVDGRPAGTRRVIKTVVAAELEAALVEVADELARAVSDEVSKARQGAPRDARPVAVAAHPTEPEPIAAPAPAPRAVAPAQPATPSPAPMPTAAPAGVVAAPQPTAWALVVGVERYRDVAQAEGARGDAEAVAAVLRRTLGIPETHLKVLLDERAGRADIEKNLEWLKASVPPGGRVYLFYSGHGAPDAESGTSYLLPYDVDPAWLGKTSLKLPAVLEALGQTKAREVLAFVDACFSGSGGRSVMAKGVRPLVALKAQAAPMAVTLFTAASGAEISGGGAGAPGGLFTRTVVEALSTGRADLDGDGQVSLKELLDFVSPRVTREAAKLGRAQHPALLLGPSAPKPDVFPIAWGYPPQ